jgi:hypothetical protein
MDLMLLNGWKTKDCFIIHENHAIEISLSIHKVLLEHRTVIYILSVATLGVN